MGRAANDCKRSEGSTKRKSSDRSGRDGTSAPVISFASPKGGAGKTTATLILASELLQLGALSRK